MRSRIFTVAILFASLPHAKEPKHHQTGTLLQMDSAECGVDENSGKSVVGRWWAQIRLTRRLTPYFARNTSCRAIP